jgi:hypothetical protein
MASIFYYEDYLLETKELFYIGTGSLQRVGLRVRQANKEHYARHSNTQGYFRRIVKEFKTKEDALNYERKMLLKYKAQGVNLVNKCPSESKKGVKKPPRSKYHTLRQILASGKFPKNPELVKLLETIGINNLKNTRVFENDTS